MAYTYDRRTAHTVEVIPKGKVITFRVGGAELHVRHAGPDLKVISVDSPEDMRGQGVGKALYRALFTEAQRLGMGVVSDLTVEEPAARVWESMKREGFPIEKHPKAEMVEVEPENAWFVPGDKPVFRMRR
jgi:GNAT superfamily N-acetyltransferase